MRQPLAAGEYYYLCKARGGAITNLATLGHMPGLSVFRTCEIRLDAFWHSDGFAVYQALRLVFVASATNVEWVIDMRIV